MELFLIPPRFNCILWTTYAFSRSRPLKRNTPAHPASTPIPAKMPADVQFGDVAGASVMWCNSDKSRIQWFRLMIEPTNCTMNDQIMMPYAVTLVSRGINPNISTPTPSTNAAGAMAFNEAVNRSCSPTPLCCDAAPAHAVTPANKAINATPSYQQYSTQQPLRARHWSR